jgi:hypothetical protein
VIAAVAGRVRVWSGQHQEHQTRFIDALNQSREAEDPTGLRPQVYACALLKGIRWNREA